MAVNKKVGVPGGGVIIPLHIEVMPVNIIGESPLIMHRFSFKARQQLLLPPQKMNAAAKAANIKHNPLQEYRECFYRNRDDTEPTLFHMPVSMLQAAIASAAMDMPGIAKAEAKRWISVIGLNNAPAQLNVYGKPEMYTTMVRNSGIGSAPDVRTRPIFRKWALKDVIITFKSDPLTGLQVGSLINAAGKIIGCGDWRPQKGGMMGRFRTCQSDDPEFLQLTENEGRPVQQAAYAQPGYFDEDTEEINVWLKQELASQGKTLEDAEFQF